MMKFHVKSLHDVQELSFLLQLRPVELTVFFNLLQNRLNQKTMTLSISRISFLMQ